MGTVSRADVIAALTSPRALRLFDGTILGAEPRDDHVLVLADEPRLGGSVAVAVEWPDDELTGMSTGEPCDDLTSWVAEVAMFLDEEFATADLRYARLGLDPVAGYTIVEFASCLNPDVMRQILHIAGLGPDKVSVPPHSTEASIGLSGESAPWRVYSADQDSSIFESELYAWGDLHERVHRRWPCEVDAAWATWNGEG
jgi:hypothetical protein